MGKISQKKQAFTEQLIRESVYTAVLQVLSSHGLEKLTIQRVAAAANLATGTLYNYFKDKDALLVYAAVRMFDQLYQRQNEVALLAIPPLKKLQAFVETTFDFFNKNDAFFRFLDQAQVYCKMDMAVKRSHLDKETKLLASVIEEGIKNSDFKAVNSQNTAIFFHRAIIGILCVNPELGEFDPGKEARQLTKMFRTFLT
jgi:AcrR family transcriptional regulator